MGQVLEATTGTWAGSPIRFAYQWQDCNATATICSPISGATSSSYVVQAGDEGYALVVVVDAYNNQGSESSTSAPTGLVPSGGAAPQFAATVSSP